MKPNAVGMAVWVLVGLVFVAIAAGLNSPVFVLLALAFTAVYPLWNGVVVPLYVIADRIDRLERR